MSYRPSPLKEAAVSHRETRPFSGSWRRPKSSKALFAGSNRYVVDYLADEVLSQQSEHVQAFLLQYRKPYRTARSSCKDEAQYGGSPGGLLWTLCSAALRAGAPSLSACWGPGPTTSWTRSVSPPPHPTRRWDASSRSFSSRARTYDLRRSASARSVPSLFGRPRPPPAPTWPP